MTEDLATGRDEPFATLLAVLDEPGKGPRHLPRLVGLLDDEEETVRAGAAWAACHVVAHHPDTAGYLTRRLVDRVSDEEPALEAELVYAYVAGRFPDTVAAELDDMAAEARNRSEVRSIEGSLARANYHLPEIGNRNVGRTRLPGEGGSAGPSQRHTDAGGPREHEDPSAYRTGDDSDRENDDGGGTQNGDGGGTQNGDGGTSSDDAGETGATTEGRAPSDGSGWQPADEFPVVVYESRFDQLTVLGKRRRARYGNVYRTRGVVDDDELAVGLLLFDRPAENRDAFAADLDEHLGRWAGVDSHDNVVTLYDWGGEPRPWMATEYTAQTLANRSRLTLEAALWNAQKLATAVEHIHENGIVHGGIDPQNVVYHGNVLDQNERQPPLLANLGLLHVVRRYFDPTNRLDPRYAAPEYFDSRFGRIDHATDVYQLGATLYRLVTGRAPYDGDYGRIRERILSDPPPRPGDVVDVPATIDDVVTKAMARQKLHRYETVTHLEQELRGIGAETDHDDR